MLYIFGIAFVAFFVCLSIMQIFPSNWFRWIVKSELTKQEEEEEKNCSVKWCAVVSVGRDYCYFCRYSKMKINWSKSYNSIFVLYYIENLSNDESNRFDFLETIFFFVLFGVWNLFESINSRTLVVCVSLSEKMEYDKT